MEMVDKPKECGACGKEITLETCTRTWLNGNTIMGTCSCNHVINFGIKEGSHAIRKERCT